MTYEERLEKLKKRVGYQGNSEYTVSQEESENARDRLAAARQRYAEEAKAKQAQRTAASEVSAQSVAENLTSKNYEKQKEELKQDKKDAWNSRVSTWFKKVGTQLNPDATDTEKAIAKSRYNSAKARHQTLSDDYDTLKENKWNSTQEENAGIINSNSEVKSLVEQARNAKIKADAAKQNMDYYQPLSNNTSVANNLALQEQQKNYQAEYNTYSEIISKLDNLGYDGESLVDTFSRQKNLEEMEEFSGEVSDFASEHPVASSAAYVALNSAQSEALPDIIQGGLSALINDEYVPLDINSGSFGATNIRDTIAETNSENIENTVQEKTNSEFLANASSFLYQTGLSMGDSVSRAALPTPLASALAGASAAASTAKDATERGLSAENTLGTALSAGLNEAIGEGLSLGNLKAMKASGKGGIANTISDILKQAGVEGSEEVVTDILNTVSDQIINGDDSALSQQYQTYIDSGMTSQQAQKQVAIDYAKQVGQSFLGGAISGGVLGTGATALRNAQLNSAYRAEGRAIQDTGREGVAAVINEGLAQDSNSPAYRAASELLSRNYETDSYEIPETLSGRDLGRLGRLQQMNVQANDVSAFSEAVSGEENSENLIKTFEKLTKGENINRKDANALMNNKTARTALSELTAIDEIGSGNVKNNRKLLGRVSDFYRDNTMQTFSASEPMNNEQTRQYLNRRLNSVGLQSENEATGTITSRSISNDSVNRAITAPDGTADSVQSINRVENGIVYLNTANGNVVEAQNVDFANSQTADLYNSAAAYDTDTAKVYTFGFTDNGYSGSVYDYNTGFNAVYRAQKQGYSLDDAYNLARESSSITPMQAELAYNAAKNEDIQASKPVLPDSDETSSENIKPAETGAEIATKINKTQQDKFNKALNAKKKPGVTVIAEKMSKSQKAEADLIGEYAKSIGREVIVVDDTEELGYGAANGMYQNGKIVLALNNTGGVMSVYFGHELFHDLKQTAPKQANELQAYVLDRLKSNADYNYDFRYAQLEDKYSDNLKGKTDAQKKSVIDEEIAANACFTVLSNEDNFTALVKQNRSLAEKVRDFFADFAEKIKNALTNLAIKNAEYKVLQNDYEAQQKILEMFNKALNSEQKNSTTDNGSVKYSIVELEDGTSYVKANRKVITGTTVAEMRKDITNFFNEILKYGDLNVTTSDSNVITINKKTAKKSRDNYISVKGKRIKLSENEFRVKLSAESHIDELAEISTFSHSANDSKNHSFAKNRFDYYKTYFQDFDGAYYEITLSVGVNDSVATVYNVGRIRKDDLPSAKILAVRGSKALGKSPISSISNSDENVKFSLKTDSAGNELSEQQQEYFKDSKVRDEEGRLLVVYHGTDTDFTVFDRTKARANMDIQGNFFSPWEIDAKGYGEKVGAYYLNIINPAPEGVAYKALNKFKGQNYAGVKARDFLERMGYDGVNNGNEEYIAFYPEQIKLVENTAPTDNSDIRYSLKEENDDYSYDTLVSKPDMPVTVINDQKDYTPGKSTRENVVDEAQRSGLSVGRKDSSGNVYVYVNDTDTEVMLSKRGLRHSLDRRLSIIAPVTENIGPIIKNSVRINELSPEFETIKNSYVLVGIAKNQKNEPYVVSFVVNRASNEVMSVDVLYAVNAKTEPAGSLSPELSSQRDVSLTGSTVSISDLLDYVNRYYPDILPEDVLRHYGYTARPDGVIGESALYSLKEEDNTSIFEDNEELNEAAEDVQNMLRFVSTENSELRKAFDIRTVRQAEDSSVAKVAAYLRKQYDSNYKKSDLVSNLAGLYNYITNAGENIDNEYVWRTAKSIAANVLANTQYKDTTLYEDYKQFRERIRTQNILVPDSVKADMTDYNAFRKRNFGRMRLSNDSGVALDKFYSELSSEEPAFFPPDAVLSEQLENIENFFVSTSPVYYNGAEMMAESEGLSIDEYTNIVASDIFNQYFDVPEVKSYVSKSHEREMQELKSDYEAQIKDMRTLYQQRYEDQLVALRTENEQRLAEMKDKNNAALQKLKEKNLEAIAKQKAHFKDVSKRATQRRNASKLRESIRRNLKKIARLGAKPDKKKHIPNAILDSVKAFADTITLDNTKQDQKIRDRLNQFRDAFESIKKDDSEYAVMAEAYKDYISAQIIELQNTVGDKTIKQLSVAELEQIDKLVKMTAKSISNINKLFNKERNATIDAYAEKVKSELAPLRKERVFNNSAKSLMFNSMKPEYFFQYLGSDTFLELYHDLRHGEDVWAVDVQGAREKALELRKKYGWHEWDRESKQKFSTIGGEIELTLQERLGIYANSLGEHTKNHLLGGGFKYQPVKHDTLKSKFTRDTNDNSAHRLSEDDISDIASSLSEEQQTYVKDMISYLSTVMGAKGNEISRALYDIDLFTEKMYYPAKVDSESRHQSTKEVRAEKQLKNAGFTNAAIQNAKQPVVLMDFDDVWAQHIDEMSKYHAFVLPLENLDRVYNLYSVKDGQYSSIKEVIKDAYGSKALDYIEYLIKDINGGVVQEAGTDIISRLTSLFKKNAVFASMSVTIQQPSAIARALSEVDAKYFAKTTGSGFNRKSYEEMKKYAPIAVIKEMGYFDTNMAQNTVDYLNKDFYEGAKEKLSAFRKDGSYRDDVMTFFASKADEIIWTHIWNAVKAETKAKHPELSENSGQLLKEAGTRFTEVITKTQVYDSVFSRSGLMRSRDSGVRNAMAFMAEPTTSLNMLSNAIIQAKRGKISKKQGARVLGSLVASSALNALLQTIVTAARSDDDDKEYAEVYLAQLLPNFIDNLNPINQIAFLKDIVSIFQGYDVTRSDMSVITDLYKALQKLGSENVSLPDKITGLAGAVAALFGLPLKNVIRDVKAAVNVIKDAFDDDQYNRDDAVREFKDEMNSYLGFELFKTDLESAVKGVQNGDMETYEKYADEIYASDDAYDLLYEVLKKYGADSYTYKREKERVIDIKKEHGSKNPNPDSSMKKRALKEYAKLREHGTYEEAESLRQICIVLYGSMTDVEEALKDLQEKESEN